VALSTSYFELRQSLVFALVGPLVESHFTHCFDEMTALAKVAKAAITTARHCHRPDVGIPEECYSFARGRYVK
jgi:hypothetical protein